MVKAILGRADQYREFLYDRKLYDSTVEVLKFIVTLIARYDAIWKLFDIPYLSSSCRGREATFPRDYKLQRP